MNTDDELNKKNIIQLNYKFLNIPSLRLFSETFLVDAPAVVFLFLLLGLFGPKKRAPEPAPGSLNLFNRRFAFFAILLLSLVFVFR